MSRFAKPRCASSSNCGSAIFSSVTPSFLQRLVAERPAVEHELDVERGRQLLLDHFDRLGVEALASKRRVVDAGRVRERAVADRIGFDLGDIAFAVAERAERLRHRLVDDLEVAAAGELLELHEREVGLDAGGVAIHDQTDRAGRRDHGGLRVAEAVLLAELERAVPGAPRARPARWSGQHSHRAAPAGSRAARSPPCRRGRRARWLRMTRSMCSRFGS